MTLAAPARSGPVVDSNVLRMPRSGSARYLAGDGAIAVTATVRAETAAAAAADVCRAVERDQARRGNGPVRVLSWTATRQVPVLAGLGRRRRHVFGGPGPADWADGDGDDGDGGDGGDGGTAGVREPRRPGPAPGSMSAALDPPREMWGRFPL
jgi:hypothetical protein